MWIKFLTSCTHYLLHCTLSALVHLIVLKTGKYMCICGEEAWSALSGPLVGLGRRYLYPDTHPPVSMSSTIQKSTTSCEGNGKEARGRMDIDSVLPPR